MARGNSGRIVLEIDPKIKQNLYSELSRHNLTLKDWFLDRATSFINNSTQPPLFAAEDYPEYKGLK